MVASYMKFIIFKCIFLFSDCHDRGQNGCLILWLCGDIFVSNGEMIGEQNMLGTQGWEDCKGVIDDDDIGEGNTDNDDGHDGEDDDDVFNDPQAFIATWMLKF